MKRSPFTPVGISALLVIFAVLCLAVFALLSVSTVQAQKRLAESSRQAVVGYYEADCEAERILSALRAGVVPQGVTQQDDIFTYTCRISDTQALAVTVKIDQTRFSILQWQTVFTADWESDEDLPVWNGQIP